MRGTNLAGVGHLGLKQQEGVEMAGMGERMEALLAVWDDATAPLDAKKKADPLLLASASEIARPAAPKPAEPVSKQVCRPWDHADFLARVATFGIGSWFAKPEPVSAFECARYGWLNVAPDQLHCICCNHYLCFQIDVRLSEAGALAVAKKFAAQLATGHAPECPWTGNASPEAFTTLPIATKRQVFDSFTRRLQEDVAHIQADTKFQERFTRSFRVADEVVSKVLKEASTGDETSLDSKALAAKLVAQCCPSAKDVSVEMLVKTALLVLCGWKFDDKNGDQRGILWCESCNRRWELFQAAPDSKSDDFSSDTEQSEPPTKRVKVEPCVVAVLAQHRRFCPWVTSRQPSQLAGHLAGEAVEEYGENDAKLWRFMKLPGWQQYAQALQLLGDPAERAIVTKSSTEIATKTVCKPEQALESVQAVLDL